MLQGDPTSVAAAAARLRLPVHRVLDEFVVVSANAAQVAALRAESAVKSVAGDLRSSR